MTEKKKTRWTGGSRDLPKDWKRIKQEVHERDGHRCTQILPSGNRCPRGRATGHRIECDHLGSKWDHRLEMLTTLCQHHHEKKTAAQGVAAKEARYAKPAPRHQEDHPGRIR